MKDWLVTMNVRTSGKCNTSSSTSSTTHPKTFKTKLHTACALVGLLVPNMSMAASDLELQIQALKQQLQSLEQKVTRQAEAVKENTAIMKNSAQSKSFGGHKADFRLGNTDINIGGFVKLDMSLSDYSAGNAALASIGEDFYVPSVTPVNGNDGDVKFHAHAKTSRFNISAMTKTKKGHVKAFLEFDAIGSAQGDERISNSSSERIRHAFIDWDIDGTNIIRAGQAWSTFFNVGVLPESLDFVGPVGVIFERQPQLRYTRKFNGGASLQFSIENPATTLYSADSSGKYAGRTFDQNSVPDIVIRYNGKMGDLSYSLAVMTRELKYEEGTRSEAEQGYAISLAAKYKLENSDELRFMFNHGDALGRYMALNGFKAGAVDSTGEIDLITSWGAVVSYKHHWSPKWRSNLTLSSAAADNPSYLTSDTPKQYQSLHLNLLYSPVPRLTIGGEYIFGTKQVENINRSLLDDEGNLKRLLFSVKYAF